MNYLPEQPVWNPEDDRPECVHGVPVYLVRGEPECECEECYPRHSEDEDHE